MSSPSSPEELDGWLREYGWHPERNIGEEAEELVRSAVRVFAEYGVSTVPSSCALNIVRNYGKLKFFLHDRPENHAVMVPGIVYQGQAEEVAEFEQELGEKMFAVGYDTYDGALFLVDDSNRVFLLHHSGNYFLGNGMREAFFTFVYGEFRDAEDFRA